MTTPREVHTVTGAFGYSGQYITRLLLQQGQEVRNGNRSGQLRGGIALWPVVIFWTGTVPGFWQA